jgi:hypothetical protein
VSRPRHDDSVELAAGCLGDDPYAGHGDHDVVGVKLLLGRQRPGLVGRVIRWEDLPENAATVDEGALRLERSGLAAEVEKEGDGSGVAHARKSTTSARNRDTAGVDVFDEIAAGAVSESPVWAEALRPQAERERLRVFSALAPPRFELGLETVYEAYLVHYGRPRLFAPGVESERVLLGDYLYAHGLVRVSDAGGVDAVAAMAELISRCASLRAAGDDGDGEAWVDAAAALGGTPSGDEIAAVLDRHWSLAGAGTIPR